MSFVAGIWQRASFGKHKRFLLFKYEKGLLELSRSKKGVNIHVT